MPLYRLPTDFAFGTLSIAAALGDTTLQSAAFAGLPGGSYSTTAVLPITLLNASTGAREEVWVTAHTASATSVTVVRGKEGSTAQAWPSGTTWICSPTAARDASPVATTAALLTAMTDKHVGMRSLEIDTGLLKTSTYSGGDVADVGACLPSEVGPIAAGGSMSSSGTVLVRPGCVLSATPSAGLVAVTFTKPFPNGYIGAVAGSISGAQFVGPTCCESGTATGMQLRPVQSNGATPGVCSLFYVAYGW